MCFPSHVEQKRVKQTTLRINLKKLQKKENCLWTVLPCIKVAGRHFKKSLFLALIFKNSDLKCLSAITFSDKFFLPAFFSPGFSNQMFIAHLLLFLLLFLHGSNHR